MIDGGALKSAMSKTGLEDVAAARKTSFGGGRREKDEEEQRLGRSYIC